ncbi:MAG: dethiobiotin synthase [Sphingobacteriales bacterium]|nr:dethiobiotin synthase [Sphingobacteriales bacterium]
MSPKPIFITGISTGIGKTITSAVLVEKLKADYWKPIQSGDLNDSDTLKVKSLVSNKTSFFYPEAYRLTQPYSPHKSAELDGVRINLDNFVVPKTSNHLIIEGAGGLMVPLNDKDLVVDLIIKFEAEVILVVQHYLGSINHTLLSIELLNARNINLKGIIYNGIRDEHSEKAILNFSKSLTLGRINNFDILNRETIIAAGSSIDID